MRKLVSILAATIIVFFAITGCKKSDTQPPGTPYFMKANINGAAFNTGSCAADLGFNGTMEISASAIGGYPQVLITLPGYRGIGTYNFPDTSGNDIAFAPSRNALLYDVSGRLTITADTPYVSGTFSFVCNDSTKVTNGSFTAKL